MPGGVRTTYRHRHEMRVVMAVPVDSDVVEKVGSQVRGRRQVGERNVIAI